MLDRVSTDPLTYSPEVAMAVQAMRDRDKDFYARLTAASRPFGWKDAALGAGLGLRFLIVFIYLGVVVHRLLG